MVTRTAGPFDYFKDRYKGVTGDSIRADAEDPKLNAGTMHALSGELHEKKNQTAGQISGDIGFVTNVCVNPETLSASTRSLAAKGYFAVGLIDGFAGMVDVFDATVNGLNVKYWNTLAAKEHEARTNSDAKDDDTADEKHLGPGVKRGLNGDYAKAVDALDAGAAVVAAKFKEGPTDANVRSLIRLGLIPLGLASVYPGLKLDSTDRWYYYQAIGQPDPDDSTSDDDDPPWWKKALDIAGDAGVWTYNHTIVPTVNGLADLGQAAIDHPGDVISMAAGAGLMALGATGEVGGGLLDITGVGAVVGVPANIASAAVIASGATLTAGGAADLAHHATENHNTVLNQANGPSGGGRTPGDPLPESSRPDAAGSGWKGRVADNGKGDVWQDPASANAPKGSPRDANEVRDMEPTPRYPHGYVRFYNDRGQPVGLDGKPGDDTHTHIPKNADGTYPTPTGWNP